MNIFKKIVEWFKSSCCGNDLIDTDYLSGSNPFDYQDEYFYTIKIEDSLSYSDTDSS